MIKTIKKTSVLIFSLTALVFSTFAMSTGSVVAQDPCQGAADIAKCNACESIKVAGSECTDANESVKSANNTANSIIDIVAIISGVICVLMMIIGGFRYIVSGGDSNGVQGAKNTIIYALIGLIIVVSARTIAVFVFTQVKK